MRKRGRWDRNNSNDNKIKLVQYMMILENHYKHSE